MLRLYNSLTRKIEDFTPLTPHTVTYYSCGPTVYDYAHIGHARTYTFADVLERVLAFNGLAVKRVMNITDVGHLTSDADAGEDKMEKGAVREGKSVWDIARLYTDDFFTMLEALNIRKPPVICKATGYIPQMIDLVKRLEAKSFTYVISDGVYFDTTKFPDYGKLTGQSFSELEKGLKAGARVEIVEGKKHPTDFALWKLTPPGLKRQMEWDSPWGKGFPGWHIECSAMVMATLSETIDIHTGGVDHIPIHHTNEIAQSEAATGKQFVRFWLHGEHLLVDGKKMSKSLGNFFRVSDCSAKGFSPMALRYLFLTASYRKTMNFTWESLTAAQHALDGLYEQISNFNSQIANRKRETLSQEKLEKADGFRDAFTYAINDDVNTAKALAVLWEVIKSNIPPGDKLDLLFLFDEVLGLKLRESGVRNSESGIPEEIDGLVKKREQLRKEKKWKESDDVRREIEEKGFRVEDTSKGVVVKKI